MRACGHCHGPVSRGPRAIYCSARCKSQAKDSRRRAARIAARETKPCANPRCDGLVAPTKNALARYCTTRCQKRAKNARRLATLLVPVTDEPLERHKDEGEVWAPIPGFPRYAVSTLGRVRSYARHRPHRGARRIEPTLLTLSKNYAGYPIVNLAETPGRYRQMKVHRLVLLAFVGPPPTPKHHGSHMNAQRDDCRLANLAWETPAQNWARKGL